jgi:Arc/MetJ family transcription regulator
MIARELHIGSSVRTNIDIDDRLMRRAMQASRHRTKRAVVDEALNLLVQTRSQAAIRKLRGRIRWEGDLEASRTVRSLDR